MIYPNISTAPPPVEDMPSDVKDVFLEAREIVNASPRGAAALLRLAVQMLMPALGEKGKDLDKDIKSLVSKGLMPRIQQALDAVRVIGNNAVHPGQMTIEDHPETALALFGLVNLIVQTMITDPKEVDALYSSLPQTSRDHIDERDGNKPGDADGEAL